MSLRRFCQEHGYDPGNLSKLERGRLRPPKSREKLESYAAALGLEEGSEEWYGFFDLAAASRGEIPEDILADEDVVSRLPVLFKVFRGHRAAEEDLQRLLKLLKV